MLLTSWTGIGACTDEALLGNGSIFATTQAGDVLVHHPHKSFDAIVEHFVSAAAEDPSTVAIKMPGSTLPIPAGLFESATLNQPSQAPS